MRKKDHGIIYIRFNFVKIGDNQGMTALHFACLYGNFDVVKMLTNNGCQLMPKDKDATTPLHLACIQGNLDVSVLQLLL